DGLVVAEHAGEQRLAGADPLDGIGADLVLDRTRPPTGCPQLPDRRRTLSHVPNLSRSYPKRGRDQSVPSRRWSSTACGAQPTPTTTCAATRSGSTPTIRRGPKSACPGTGVATPS